MLHKASSMFKWSSPCIGNSGRVSISGASSSSASPPSSSSSCWFSREGRLFLSKKVAHGGEAYGSTAIQPRFGPRYPPPPPADMEQSCSEWGRRNESCYCADTVYYYHIDSYLEIKFKVT